MNQKQADEMASAIVDVIKGAVDPMKQRAAELAQRITALEEKPHVKFCGVWQPGRTYAPGDAATLKGALWICKAETPGAPGVDFIGWTLAVKSGGAR